MRGGPIWCGLPVVPRTAQRTLLWQGSGLLPADVAAVLSDNIGSYRLMCTTEIRLTRGTLGNRECPEFR